MMEPGTYTYLLDEVSVIYGRFREHHLKGSLTLIK